MDFVVKLPELKDPVTGGTFNSIIVIINKLIKYIILIPYKEIYKAYQLGFVLLDKLIRDHGIPKSITSDRDRLFTSYYWKTLIATIRIKLRILTTYHPETDS